MMPQHYSDRPERFLRDHADDDGLGRAPTDGTPAAIITAGARMRAEEAAALARLRATLQE